MTSNMEPLVGMSEKRGAASFLKQVMPILTWLPQYPVRSSLVHDLAASLTLGCVLVAQSIAHASLCHVTLIHGPYSCILPPLIYAIFGTSIHASVGTGGLISLLTGEQVEGHGDLDERSHVASLLTLMVGAFIALMGVLRLEFFVRFLSKPALSGFITGSALLIVLSQIKPMLGLPKDMSKGGGLVWIVMHHPDHLAHCNWPSLGVGVAALAFLLCSKRLKKVPVVRYVANFKELSLLVASAVFTYFWNRGLETGDSGFIPVIGPVPEGLPSFESPIKSSADIALMKALAPGAFLIAMVTFLSSFAAAKKFAMKDGYEVRAINELMAMGLANIGGAFIGAVPTQIGLSRTGLSYQAGTKSPLGGNVFVAIIVSLVLVTLSPYLYNVPTCVLNAIIVNAASHLQEFDFLYELWVFARDSRFSLKVRLEVVVWIAGFCCTVARGAFEGMLIACAVSLLLIVNQVANLELLTLGYESPGSSARHPVHRQWKSLQFHPDATREEDGIIVFRLEGPLFYANVERVQEWITEEELKRTQAGKQVKGIIISASSVNFIDSTGITALTTMIQSYKERDILFFVADAYGQTEHLISHKVEQSCAGLLKSELGQKVAKCCHIDDFVALINEHDKMCHGETSRRKLLKSTSERITARR